MQAADSLYESGLEGYGNALFAAGHFEWLIIEAISRIVNTEFEAKIAQSFNVPKLHGGGVLRTRPEVEDMRSIARNTLWAWLGREYWIPEPHSSTIFFGLALSEGDPVVAIMFRKNGVRFREHLHKFLELTGTEYYYEAGETVISKTLAGTHSLDDFTSVIEKILLDLLRSLSIDASFRASSNQDSA